MFENHYDRRCSVHILTPLILTPLTIDISSSNKFIFPQTESFSDKFDSQNRLEPPTLACMKEYSMVYANSIKVDSIIFLMREQREICTIDIIPLIFELYPTAVLVVRGSPLLTTPSPGQRQMTLK